MKYGVIDVGSNSVRLMMSENGKTLYKLINITRLAENMGDDLILKDEPVSRTLLAIKDFKIHAEKENADEIFIFGTCAVRQASNCSIFLKKVYDYTGINMDVISGENEALLGVFGALNGNDGGVIDIGGGSTEITVIKNGSCVYSKSVNIGVVKIKDFCGHNKDKATAFVNSELDKFGNIPTSDFFGIGGTATSVVAVLLGLEPYDPMKVNGFKVTKDRLNKLCDELYSLPVTEIEKLKGIQKERALVISGGVLLLKILFERLNIDKITVSERDNLEGYLMTKRDNYEKKN